MWRWCFALPQIEAGKLKLLAVIGDERTASLPGTLIARRARGRLSL